MRAKGRATKRSDGRWQTSVSLPGGGKRYLSGKSQTAVVRAAEKLRQAIADGDASAYDTRTVEEYLTEWLEDAKVRVKPGTYRRYEGLVRRQLVPGIGAVQLGKLSARDLQRLYTELVAGGLSSTTVLHVHRVLFHALRQAHRWGLTRQNVADLVTAPRPERFRGSPLTVEQGRTLLRAARGDALEAVYVLALATGMRQGELLGLQWQDVDLVAGVVSVRGTLARNADGVRSVSTTKTAGSERTLPLSTAAVQALERRREAQQAEKLLAGKRWQDSALVFTTPTGEPIEASWLLRRRFYPLLEAAGLPRVRFHDLRHTHATLLLESGAPVGGVSAQLGHSSAKLTLDTYGHVTGRMTEAIREALDTLFPAD